ncbi:hypothetical protein H6P81_018853 [Aristolochia fimbriata]|uniref:Pectinesterase inhibitor domain-containing protein n=1 Tax=Aristolochia fimbriata TaxID=158543 RepID=A0AAV7E2F9_ARIFI|nr:hypothetical protein H6P81_018853 [Aristolochia fimbriata]
MPYTRREKILDACIVITFVATLCAVILFAVLLTVLRPKCPVQKILPSSTVASDGSGDFRTVCNAVAAAPSHSRKYFGIAIKPGVYYEEVSVPVEKTRLAFIGGGTGVIVISSNRSWSNPLEDTAAATLDVKGDGFVAIDITFQNTGDPTTGYTVALANDAKETAFHHCSFKGIKGVLKAGGSPQFYGKSNIYGAVDVIWGTGSAIIQSCVVYVEKPYLPGHDQVPRALTFQQRSDRSFKGGFIFQGCSVDASPGSDQSGSSPVFLGRPGGAYSTVVFMQSYLGGLLSPTSTGWLFDSSLSPATTLYLKEYNNRGPGVGPAERRITTGEAAQFTVGSFISGDKWLPKTYVEYASVKKLQTIDQSRTYRSRMAPKLLRMPVMYLAALGALVLMISSENNVVAEVPELQVIRDLCNRTESPDFCFSILSSDPNYLGSDFDELRSIFLTLSLGKAEEGVRFISALQKKTTDPMLKEILNYCSIRYEREVVVHTNRAGLLYLERVTGALKLLSWCIDAVEECGNAFKCPPYPAYVMRETNELMKKYCRVAGQLIS